MTISSTTRIAGPFTSGTALPFTFKVFAAADLQVVRLNTTTGVESTLILTTDYTVTLNGNQNTNPGGTVTLLTGAASATSTVTITSDIANLQPTDLTNQGGFYPEVITDSLDRATIQIQQISDIGDRTLKIPISDGSSLNMELPTAAQRANSFLTFDASGEPTVVTAGSSGAPATITRQVFSGTGSQTVFTLASDPGAIGNSAQVYIGGVYQQRSTYTILGTTLTFSQAPVAGTDNIEFVNFLTGNIGSTSADLVTYTPTGSGAVARSAASKLGDVVSVKDFGAVGNGVADDTAAIQNAMLAAMGKTLFFPQGTYALASALGALGIQIQMTLTGNLRLVGDAAIIKCTSTAHRSHMLYLTTNGNTVSLDGITFDANLKCNVCIRCDDTSSQGTNDISVQNCSFINSWAVVGGTSGYEANAGAQFFGGFRFVSITDCISSNHSRELGAGNPGISGTQGICVAGLSSYYPQNVNVVGCLFSEIKNSETTASANNVDCDGLVVLGGLTTGTTYIPSTATISNNSFVNCKGRAIKIQNDESVIVNNTIRFAITGITGGSGGMINCQVAAGNVSHNVWHFGNAPGNLNPFDPAGTLGAVGEFCIGLYAPQLQRPRSVTALGNVAFNNVLEATGVLLNMLTLAESAADTYPIFMSIKDNRICGGAVQDFANIPLRNTGYGDMYLTICDNHASKMTRSFMSNSTSGAYNKNFIIANGNVNWNSTPVRHLINTSSPTTYYPANIVAFSNVNIGLDERKTRATDTAFVPRIGDIAPVDSAFGGMYSVQSVVIEDQAEYSFPEKAYTSNGSSLRFISSSYGGTTNFLFSQGFNSIASIYAGSDIAFANTSNPNSSGDLNVWIDGSGLIRIKNRLGTSRVVTLFSMG